MRSHVIFYCASFFFCASHGRYQSLFLADVMGLSAAHIGVVLALTRCCAYICGPLWGILGDTTQKHRRILTFGICGCITMMFLMMPLVSKWTFEGNSSSAWVHQKWPNFDAKIPICTFLVLFHIFRVVQGPVADGVVMQMIAQDARRQKTMQQDNNPSGDTEVHVMHASSNLDLGDRNLDSNFSIGEENPLSSQESVFECSEDNDNDNATNKLLLKQSMIMNNRLKILSRGIDSQMSRIDSGSCGSLEIKSKSRGHSFYAPICDSSFLSVVAVQIEMRSQKVFESVSKSSEQSSLCKDVQNEFPSSSAYGEFFHDSFIPSDNDCDQNSTFEHIQAEWGKARSVGVIAWALTHACLALIIYGTRNFAIPFFAGVVISALIFICVIRITLPSKGQFGSIRSDDEITNSSKIDLQREIDVNCSKETRLISKDNEQETTTADEGEESQTENITKDSKTEKIKSEGPSAVQHLRTIFSNPHMLTFFINCMTVGGTGNMFECILFVVLYQQYQSMGPSVHQVVPLELFYLLCGFSVFTCIITEVPTFLMSRWIVNHMSARTIILSGQVVLILRTFGYSFLNLTSTYINNNNINNNNINNNNQLIDSEVQMSSDEIIETLENKWRISLLVGLLLLESLHGLSFGLSFSGSMLYVQKVANKLGPGFEATNQALLQLFFGGLGPFLFTISSGFLINTSFGASKTFRTIAFIVIISMICFITSEKILDRKKMLETKIKTKSDKTKDDKTKDDKTKNDKTKDKECETIYGMINTGNDIQQHVPIDKSAVK